MRTALRVIVVGAGLLASAAAFADQSNEVTIKMQKESFVPAQIKVAVGAQVTWTNTDQVPHSVTALDGSFDSGPILPGKSFQWTPKEAGILNYHCIFHPSMTAALTVRVPAVKSGQKL
jgi:plastocyanin